MNQITSVCVYCASSTKIDQTYFDAAMKLGASVGKPAYPFDKWSGEYRIDAFGG